MFPVQFWSILNPVPWTLSDPVPMDKFSDPTISFLARAEPEITGLKDITQKELN